MSTLTVSQYAPSQAASQRGPAPTPTPSIALNGHLVIFSLATVLALATASECQSITHLPSLLYGAVLWGWWGAIASATWTLGKRIPSSLGLSLKTLSIQIAAGCALGVMHLLFLGSLDFTVRGWANHETALMVWTRLLEINRFGIELLIYGFVFGVVGIIQFQIRAQREAIKSLELQRQLSAAHLRALQMQLEPHFLFNTLNAITTLVELGRQKEASETLNHLNAILKSTLKRTTPEKVPLSQELEIVENYLAIEQVRFADRLQIQIKIDPNALDGLVPCFLLQPIVENAIRHGIARCENEGIIEASARRNGESLHLTIRDSGRESGPDANHPPQTGHGIGLKNTRQRLTHFYQEDYAMNAHPLSTGGYEVEITIPYERATLA